MRHFTCAAGFLSLSGLVNAQYFSIGWSPGQPVSSQSPSPVHTSLPSSSPVNQHYDEPAKISFLDNLLTVGPLAAISSLVGLNITASPSPTVIWDERIPLITDENYANMIVDETLTPEEEKERVWFLIVTIAAGQQDTVSTFVDNVFDATYNYTLEKQDLNHVRFGRIDYLNVTKITTKWVVWSAPYLVVLKDRGQSLRFYKTGQLRLSDEILYQFLKEEGWRFKEPWKSVYGPGGEREYILDYLAQLLSTIYSTLIRVPKWLLYMMSGGLATLLINLLHKPSPPKSASKRALKPTPASALKPTPASAPPSPRPAATSSTATNTPQKGPTKRRGKK